MGLVAAIGLWPGVQVIRAADPVHFEDPRLKSAVEQALGGIDPTAQDMLGLTSLGCVDAGIGSLVGLGQLFDLDIQKNRIADVCASPGLWRLYRG